MRIKAGLSLLLYCFLLLPTAWSQSTNNCAVKAVLSPAVSDTVVADGKPINITSASSNATSFRFIVNEDPYPLNKPVSGILSVGLTTIQLVAYNGSCTDTAVSYYLSPGQAPTAADNPRTLFGNHKGMEAVTGLISTQSGGHLLTGRSIYNILYTQEGLFIKTKPGGCIEWARKISFPSDVNMIKETGDGGFISATTLYTAVSGRMIKFDAAGRVLWTKALLKPGLDGLTPKAMEATPDGGAILVGTDQFSPSQFLIRLNQNGDVVWQKAFTDVDGGQHRLSSLLLKDNAIFVGGNASYYATNKSAAFIQKVNYSDGATIWKQQYSGSTGSITINEIVGAGEDLLVNISTPTGQTNKSLIVAMMHLDTAGQVKSTTAVGENYVYDPQFGPYNTAGNHLGPSGKSFYFLSAGSNDMSLQPGINYTTRLVKIDPNFNVLWMAESSGNGVPRFFYPAPAGNEGLAIAGTEFRDLLPTYYASQALTLKVMDSAGGNANADCYFKRKPFELFPITVVASPLQLQAETNGGYTAEEQHLPVVNYFPSTRVSCPDYVGNCNYLKLEGPRAICNLGQDYQFIAHMDKTCNQVVKWRLPQGVQAIEEAGNIIKLHFGATGRYVIYAENFAGCIPLQDSIVIKAGGAGRTLDLGADKQVCGQVATTFHAGKGFTNYAWQDGSSDSLFTANKPGKYWVTVQDSCGNLMSDTVWITATASIPLFLGADRTKCNADTIHLDAGPGFAKYSWSPTYFINNSNSQQVVVNPLRDTFYTVIAETAAGCLAYDTIHITVRQSPKINLGNDTSFCVGDSTVLDAGIGFSNYLWSDGSVSRMLSVKQAGVFSVLAVSPQGCIAADTIRVLSVYTTPVIPLSKDSFLCSGSAKVLNAGNFADYQWQDGSQAANFLVSQPGKYYVSVTDQHHCKASDTVFINRMIPSPALFLPADTNICNYAQVQLHTLKSYNQYHWSTGATTPTITISQPGRYWLEVVDQQHCSGSDTINIVAKGCLVGLYAPTAFSPNHDGKNDSFKPMLFGTVTSYQLAIFDRWGHPIFQTTDPQKGWDGTNGGHLQDDTQFIWICTFQLAGQEKFTQKGLVSVLK